jgi:hypothetical protein
MTTPLNYLHALALLETFVFLYVVEQRPRLAPARVGMAHFAAATALVAGAFLSYFRGTPDDSVSVLIAGVLVAAVAFVGFAVLPLGIANVLRRRVIEHPSRVR